MVYRQTSVKKISSIIRLSIDKSPIGRWPTCPHRDTPTCPPARANTPQHHNMRRPHPIIVLNRRAHSTTAPLPPRHHSRTLGHRDCLLGMRAHTSRMWPTAALRPLPQTQPLYLSARPAHPPSSDVSPVLGDRVSLSQSPCLAASRSCPPACN
ncbi:hypothetical protein GUJ93_ZPchr0002g26489 [Zizania palustris]|uniref:Uncharacterized protein n=1 Tax=Zizania palustris TaxID=103762 RepID=A0A8J5VU66_ZIZPA|nr:hypothetical protein GUJ93_ZPchr0002g26489 [Zizania palustris]